MEICIEYMGGIVVQCNSYVHDITVIMMSYVWSCDNDVILLLPCYVQGDTKVQLNHKLQGTCMPLLSPLIYIYFSPKFIAWPVKTAGQKFLASARRKKLIVCVLLCN